VSAGASGAIALACVGGNGSWDGPDVAPAVFAGAMVTEAPEHGSHDYATVGAQLDLNFTVALRLPMVFSVGAAGGWRDGHYRKTEWLASLKIM